MDESLGGNTGKFKWNKKTVSNWDKSEYAEKTFSYQGTSNLGLKLTKKKPVAILRQDTKI